MEPTTQIILSNPYVAQPSVSIVDVQLMLLAGAVCLVVGLLLAEQTTLRAMLTTSDESMSGLLRRRVTEAT